MKFVVLFLLFTATSLPQFFNNLRGLEDYSNNTHLFYRILSESDIDTSNSIYHLDISTNTETLFLEEKSVPELKIIINDYEFWDRSPFKFIYSKTTIAADTITEIIKYTGDILFTHSGPGGNVELSRQDTNVIFIEAGGYLFKTTDNGRSWSQKYYGRLVSVSPFSDNIIFTSKDDSLYKSNNGGNDFYLVLPSAAEDTLNNFYYDKNGINIFRLALIRDVYYAYNFHLYRSNNNGDPYSWSEWTDYSGYPKFYQFTNDTSIIGKLFFFIKPEYFNSPIEIPLQVSHDFGFSLLNHDTVNYKPAGIYIKPGTNILYSISSRDLYEISPGSKIILKHLDINPKALSYYPLRNDTKWVYHYTDWNQEAWPWTFESYDYFVEVRGDTLLNDGFSYKKIFNSQRNRYFYQRIDSAAAIVYEHTDGLAYSKYSLNLAPGDLFKSLWAIEEFMGNSDMEFGGSSRNSKVYLDNTVDNAVEYYLTEGIGLQVKNYYYYGGSSKSGLKGMIIDGVVYGDTVLVGVEDEETQPGTFNLNQNYPNPFNPSTIIRFYLPRNNFITLKVFDVLGNEISTLINKEMHRGEHSISFNGEGLSSGVYFYIIKGEGINQTRKMTLIK